MSRLLSSSQPVARHFFAGASRLCLIGGLALLGFSLPATAQDLQVSSDPVTCLEIGENGVVWATVDNNVPDADVRLYFRRMNDAVEDLYWTEMQPAGDGRYWGIFPKPEDHALEVHELIEERNQVQQEIAWARWWREKDGSTDRNPNGDLDQDLIRERASQGQLIERDWLGSMSDEEFQDWLETLENEPAEYYTSVNDFQGETLGRSATRVAEVRENCRVELTPEQEGYAENLIVGETAYWQRDESVFHWMCDGIVARVDPTEVWRADGICRACVIAWWERPGVLVPGAVLAGGLGGVLLIDDESPPPVSPSGP